MEAQPKEIRYYVTEEDVSPFLGWFKSLRDGVARNKIEIRLKRVELVLLLCGGDKNSQDRDIQLAQKYWSNYESNQD
jgi:putative component of toxin-antitoxin plasmid stabilization module